MALENPLTSDADSSKRDKDPELLKIAKELGISYESVHLFAKISSPENAHRFSIDAAHKAFAPLAKKRD